MTLVFLLCKHIPLCYARFFSNRFMGGEEEGSGE